MRVDGEQRGILDDDHLRQQRHRERHGKYSVAANTATSSRTAGSTVAGLSFTTTQLAAAAPTTQTYTITASAGTNGAISPTGSVSVNSGASQTFSIKANSGYTVSSVTVDGKSKGSLSSYTFSKVAANHTISATFTSSKRRWSW